MPTLTVERKLERLMKKTNKLGEILKEELGNCWEWTGSKIKGYGIYGRTGAHRISYELHKGKIPPKLHVLHICDNRGCINPDHLRLGTNADNVADKVSKGRALGTRALRISGQPGIKITPEQIKEIRDNPHDKCQCCLSRQFKITPQHISRIQHNEAWSPDYIQKTLEEDFWDRSIHSKILVHNSMGECWEMKRAKDQISFKGKSMLGHRVAYIITYGDIPKGNVVRHKCDNAKCKNPSHLELGSIKDNNNDTIMRNRNYKGSGHHNSKLTEENVIEIFNQKDKKSIKELATEYGVTQYTIRDIHKKKVWKHILIPLEEAS